MGADQNHDWAKIAASALDWWREAGVDTLVEDAPFDWLAAVETAAPLAFPSPVAPASAPALAALPDTREAFAAWRLGEDAPEARWGGAAIAASGPQDAELMVFVDCPERDDRETLLEGDTGRLFDRMLTAIGRSRADTALASVCTRRPTTGRVPRDIADRLGEIARHHVALAAPKRLLAMGDAASRALLAMSVADARGRTHLINHKQGSITHVVATHHPRFLLDRPAAKAETWKDLLMLTGEIAS
ncbi:uracil-DNA glycosylase family protein [Sphingomonas sp. BK580]|uniref:uracil-DNA glycosylase family protein n=1 Tax=Sphingomonas sp. BK580 TaxID=2586972 RepID=UPI00160E6184|nr:uracil-DNA glycosylase family protein [Sphingomonas sp. BK580]MBB3692941.1 DNA polymerase [Sphingomonas sp. BK580]